MKQRPKKKGGMGLRRNQAKIMAHRKREVEKLPEEKGARGRNEESDRRCSQRGQEMQK